jgi:hypothetical protein
MNLLERQLMEKWVWSELTAFPVSASPRRGLPSSQPVGWRITEPPR